VLANIRLQATNSSAASSRKLTGGTAVGLLNSLSISFSRADIEAIKLNRNLAENRSTSFLSIGLNSVQDMAGNYLRSIPSSQARQVDVYVNDTQVTQT
jgi:hypothetical protein